jgi:hypothetical protein
MARILFAPLSIAGGLLAGLIAKKAFDLAWSRIDEAEAPEPEQREATVGKLAAALAIEGAVFRVTRGLLDHASRRGFARFTGVWPGERDEPEPTD